MKREKSPSTYARLGVLALLALVSLGSLAAPPLAGAASKFVYETCDSSLPDGGPPAAQFTVNPGVPFIPYNTCAQPGGAIGINETGPTSSTFAWWTIGIPGTPGGFVEQLTISASACFLGPANDQTYVYEPGWPGNCASESMRIFHVRDAYNPFFGSGAAFNITMNCDGRVGSCGAGPAIQAHYFAAVEVDPVAPSLAPLQGSILAGGVLRGHQDLSAEADDKGGGLSRLEVFANGIAVGQPAVGKCNLAQVSNPSYSGVVAVTPTPCPTELEAGWNLDTAVYPFHDGMNSVQVCASDYSSLKEASANKTCSAPQRVTIDNSCTESSVAGGEVLSARFARSHKDAVTVPFNTTAKVTGELADNAGDPIRGATICVQMQTQGSRSGLHPVAVATTDANGHFTYKVAPGPNRKVLVGYRHDRFQVARAIHYYAHAKPTLEVLQSHVEAGGEIHLRGKLPGGRAGGRVVVLQASALHSDRWYTFRRATTSAVGVFNSRYRFDATTETTTYRIRAVAPRQHGYPWEVGHSRPVFIEVRA